MKNIVIGLVAVVIIGAGAWYALERSSGSPEATPESMTTTTAPEGSTQVASGTYTVDTSASVINWAVGKPLIEGYIDSGTLGLKDGTITVTDTSGTGTFTLDMNTIHVGNTSKKPGKEGALEEHLKKSDFFDVPTYPTGTFTISTVVSAPDSATTHQYTVTGDLTLKGQTHSVTFPAAIYLADGAVHADATFTIDRTKWGITFGSKDFFSNLANNVIENDIHLTLKLVAVKK